MSIYTAALLIAAHELAVNTVGEPAQYYYGARDAFEAVYRACLPDDPEDAIFEAYIELAGLDTEFRAQILDQCSAIMGSKQSQLPPNGCPGSET